MGLVMVEAVAAAIGPAKACRIRWGHSLGATKDSCSVNAKDIGPTYIYINLNKVKIDLIEFVTPHIYLIYLSFHGLSSFL